MNAPKRTRREASAATYPPMIASFDDRCIGEGGQAPRQPERPRPLRDSLVVLGLGVIGVRGVESSKRLRVGRLVDGQPAVDAEHLTGNEACAVAAEERDAVRDIDRL